VSACHCMDRNIWSCIAGQGIGWEGADVKLSVKGPEGCSSSRDSHTRTRQRVSEELRTDQRETSEMETTADEPASMPVEMATHGDRKRKHAQLTLEDMAPFFNVPLYQVAKMFGICTTVFKKMCRKNGIRRWPYRQVRHVLSSGRAKDSLLCVAEEHRDRT
jgi:hypothetical protein